MTDAPGAAADSRPRRSQPIAEELSLDLETETDRPIHKVAAESPPTGRRLGPAGRYRAERQRENESIREMAKEHHSHRTQDLARSQYSSHGAARAKGCLDLFITAPKARLLRAMNKLAPRGKEKSESLWLT